MASITPTEADSRLDALTEEATRYWTPFRPSWVDYLRAWVNKLAVPAWTFYFAVTMVLIVVYAGTRWADGTYPVGTFYSFHIFLPAVLGITLTSWHYLDYWGSRALAAFRPVLLGGEDEYNRVCYELTHTPARPVMLATIAGALASPVVMLLLSNDYQALLLYTSPVAVVFDVLFTLEVWVLMFVGTCITAHKVGIVSEIYSRHTRIDLFTGGPIYALNGLTVYIALSWNVLGTVFLITAPDRMRSSLLMVLILLFWGLGTAALFIFPLFGIHQRLVEEKDRLLTEAGWRMKAVVAKLHRSIDDEDLSVAQAYHDTIQAVVVEQNMLNRLPTWPWRGDHLGIIATAVMFPTVVWLVQRVLEIFLFN